MRAPQEMHEERVDCLRAFLVYEMTAALHGLDRQIGYPATRRRNQLRISEGPILFAPDEEGGTGDFGVALAAPAILKYPPESSSVVSERRGGRARFRNRLSEGPHVLVGETGAIDGIGAVHTHKEPSTVLEQPTLGQPRQLKEEDVPAPTDLS